MNHTHKYISISILSLLAVTGNATATAMNQPTCTCTQYITCKKTTEHPGITCIDDKGKKTVRVFPYSYGGATSEVGYNIFMD